MTEMQLTAVISGSIAATVSAVGVVLTTFIQRYYEHKRHSEELRARRDSERAMHHVGAIRERLERRRDVYARFMASAYSQVMLGLQRQREMARSERLADSDDRQAWARSAEKITDLLARTRSGTDELLRIRGEVELLATSPAVALAHDVAQRALLVNDPTDKNERDEFRTRITQLGAVFRVEIDDLESALNHLTGSDFFQPDFTRPLESRLGLTSVEQPNANPMPNAENRHAK